MPRNDTNPDSESHLPLSAEEDSRPVLTTSADPLEVWLPKAMLHEAVQENLDSLLERRGHVEVSLEGIEMVEALVAQRREFLAWLEGYPLDHVYLQMSPPAFEEEVYGEE
jgi:hypothetical protein